MISKQAVINGVIAILAILSILGFSYSVGKQAEKEKKFGTLYKVNEIAAMIDQQAVIDTQILDELNSGLYTLDNPLVVVNPYHISPLTAVVVFQTETPVQASLHIAGKTKTADLENTFAGFNTLHTLPIFGLYPSKENNVTLKVADSSGKTWEKTIIITTEDVLPELKTNSFNISQYGGTYSQGFNFTNSNGNYSQYKCAFDEQGDYRWYLNMAFDTSMNYNNSNSLFLSYGDEMGEQLILETNYLGKIFNVYYTPYGIHHDLEVEDRRLLITGADNYPDTIEDFIYDMNRTTGEIGRTLDYRKVLSSSREFGVKYSNQDWLHMNSIVGYKDDVIISSNYQSTIIRNDWQGNIKWMLADPSGYSEQYRQYLLRPKGANFLYTYNQHAVEILPDYDNNPDTIDIILFDNGTSRNAVNTDLQRKPQTNEMVDPPLFSRLVHYRINERDMTVEQIWQYGQTRPELFAAWRGDADLLPNGNILGLFNIDESAEHPGYSVYVEVDPSGNLVWECQATSSNEQNFYQDYRVERLEMYTESSSNLKLNTPVKNFVPLDVQQRANDLVKKEDAS